MIDIILGLIKTIGDKNNQIPEPDNCLGKIIKDIKSLEQIRKKLFKEK